MDWIKTSEQLPKENDDLIVFLNEHSFFTARYENIVYDKSEKPIYKFYVDEVGYTDIEDVTHYCILTKPII